MARKLLRSATPVAPADYEPADVSAIQALSRGEADEHQQKRAMKWIIEQAAGTYEMHYYPTERNTSFSLGRGFVGQQIVKMLRLNVSALTKGD